MSTPMSGSANNGRVEISGVQGKASLVSSEKPVEFTDNLDGTATITLPKTAKPGDGWFVVWSDDSGEHHTACGAE